MQEIELPDGTIAEFPAGMPQAEIQAVLQKQFAGGLEQETGEIASQDGGGFINRAAMRAIKGDLNPYEAFFQEARQSASDFIDKSPYAAEAAGALAASPASMRAASAVMPFNPVLGAAIGLGGPALGAMMGTAAENVIQPPETTQELFTEPLETGVEDIKTGAALTSAIPGARMLGRGVYKGLTGVGSEAAKETAQAAERVGVNLTPLQATEREGVKGYTKVIGAFPIVGTPIKQAQEQVEGALTAAFGRQLDKIGKASSRFQVSEDMVSGAEGAYKQFTADAGQLYNNFRTAAQNATVKDIFPTKPVRDSAQKFVSEMEAARIKGVEDLVDIPVFKDYIGNLSKIEGRLTIDQLEGQVKQLNDFIKKGSTEGYNMSRAVQLKEAFESSASSPSLNLFGKEARQEALELKALKDQADKFFASGRRTFETSGAKIFGRVDKNIFKPKFEVAGSRAEDDIYKAAIANKSPQKLNELRNVMGDEAFGNMARYHLDDVYKKSFTAGEGGATYFNPDKFKAAIEFGTKEGDEMLGVIFKGNEAGKQGLKDFVKAAEAAGSVTVRDPSTFVARRAVMGGVGAITALANPLKAATLAVSGRYLSKILSDPKMTKAMQAAFDPKFDKQLQRRAAVRLFDLLPMDDQERAFEKRELLGTN
jgi:hypothetical protein